MDKPKRKIETTYFHTISSLSRLTSESIEENFDYDGKIVKKVKTTNYGDGRVCQEIFNYSYDSKGNLQKEEENSTNSRFPERGEVHEGTSYYIYDRNNNMTEKEFIKSDNSKYSDNSKTIYEYNQKNQEIKETNFDLPTSDKKKYVFFQSLERKYNGQGKLVELSVYRRGPIRFVKRIGVRIGEENEDIIFDGRRVYEYDNEGRLIKEYFSKNLDPDTKRLEYIYKYDQRGNILETECLGSWSKVKKYKYFYDSKGNNIELHWVSDNPEYNKIYKSIYDEFNNEIKQLYGVQGSNGFLVEKEKITNYEYY